MNEDSIVFVCTCPSDDACPSGGVPIPYECMFCVYLMDEEDLPE